MGGGEGGSKASRDVFAFQGPKRGTTFTRKKPSKTWYFTCTFLFKKRFHRGGRPRAEARQLRDDVRRSPGEEIVIFFLAALIFYPENKNSEIKDKINRQGLHKCFYPKGFWAIDWRILGLGLAVYAFFRTDETSLVPAPIQVFFCLN